MERYFRLWPQAAYQKIRCVNGKKARFERQPGTGPERRLSRQKQAFP
jgi:hypothetical protein